MYPHTGVLSPHRQIANLKSYMHFCAPGVSNTLKSFHRFWLRFLATHPVPFSRRAPTQGKRQAINCSKVESAVRVSVVNWTMR
jgi:hypothetical protein